MFSKEILKISLMFRGLILLFMLATLEKPIKSRAATVDNLQVNGDAIVLGKFLDSKGKPGLPGQIYGVGADGRSMSFYGVGGLTNFTSLNWINVKNFGAIGNGVVDDTIALLSAISNLSTNTPVLYFHAGNYKFSSTLVLPTFKGLWMIGDSSANSRLLYSGSGDAIYIGGGIGNIIQLHDRIENISVESFGASLGANGFQLMGMFFFFLLV